ncbi:MULTISPECIES: hypothetical protein [unclassified Corynebacterium]|uniref:hypothetical protein n=1 Tax=unclassified Corynebacterium TaxID=2624378 RepID=UPI0008A5170D|nr:MULTISPECIES: hypothetical protein [unclassified Corynebacterium]OFP34550.1 hypothetical protein HMPREF2990_00360 [Corynebacterium sp. HMSC071B10]
MVGGTTAQEKREEELALINTVLSRRGKAVITGPAAARVLGLSTLHWVTRVDLLYTSRSHARVKSDSSQFIVHNAKLAESDFITEDGVRRVSVIRTLFDSYRYYGRMEALVQIESARWKWPDLTVAALLDRCETLPRARGLRGFRELIRHSADTSQSPLETIVRDRLLNAMQSGALTGVESLEFQVGFRIENQQGLTTTAWADALINGHIVLEADGAEKTHGGFGDPVEALNRERHREKELQNRGAVFYRVGWQAAREPDFIARLQRLIQAHPGQKQLPGRIDAK